MRDLGHEKLERKKILHLVSITFQALERLHETKYTNFLINMLYPNKVMQGQNLDF
jgi:hypothetical protein